MYFVEKLAARSSAKFRRDCPKLGQIPFSSATKVMVSVHNVNGRSVAILKGAYEAVVDNYVAPGGHAVSPSSGEDVPVSAATVAAIHAEARRVRVNLQSPGIRLGRVTASLLPLAARARGVFDSSYYYLSLYLCDF